MTQILWFFTSSRNRPEPIWDILLEDESDDEMDDIGCETDENDDCEQSGENCKSHEDEERKYGIM